MKGLSLACAALCLLAFSPPASAKPGGLILRPIPPHPASHGAPPPKSGPGGPGCGACQGGMPRPYAQGPFHGYTPAAAIGYGLLARQALEENGYGYLFRHGQGNSLFDLLGGTSYIQPVPQDMPAELPAVPSGPLILVEPFFAPEPVGPGFASDGGSQPHIIYVNREKTTERHVGDMPQIIYGDLPARKTSGPEIIYGDR